MPAPPVSHAAARPARRWRAAAAAALSCAGLAVQAQTDAQALVGTGQFVQALDALDAEAAKAPRDARLIAQRAMVMALQRHDIQALRLLDGLSARQPELVQPYHLMALIQAAGGDLDAARVSASRAVRADPGYLPALKALGEIQARLSRQAFEQAARLDRVDPGLRRKVDALSELLGPVTLPFAQPGMLTALAPPASPAPPAAAAAVAAAATVSPVALAPATFTLASPPPAVPLAKPPAPSGQGITVVDASGVPLPRPQAPGTASHLLVPLPQGLRVADAAAATRNLEGNVVRTFNVVTTGADVPTGFFGVPRLAVSVESPEAAASAASAVVEAAAKSMTLALSTATRPQRGSAMALSLPELPAMAAPGAPSLGAASPPAAASVAASATVAAPGAAAAAVQAEVDAALRDWAAAWSRRDVAGYVAAYASDFTGNATSREAWERERRERIAARTKIVVELSEVTISVVGDRAEARFRQRYASDTVNAVNRKLLQWQRAPGGGWRIRKEVVEG